MASKSWDRFEIKAEIQRRGCTLAEIARHAGLDSSACRSALIRRHFAGERAIARFLDIPLSELWPDRYTGKRKPHPRHNPPPAPEASQKTARLSGRRAAG